jgi:aminoglycoside phosphotransferase (APT) family kinase protein
LNVPAETETLTALNLDKTLPSSDRLITGIQKTLQKLASTIDDEQCLAELRSIDTVLNELAFRNQAEYHAVHYVAIRSLLVEGIDLIIRSPAPSSLDIAAIQQDLSTSVSGTPETSTSAPRADSKIRRVMHHLAAVVGSIRDSSASHVREYLGRVTTAENQFYAGRARFYQARPRYAPEEQHRVTATALQTYLRDRWPDRPELKVTQFKPLVGGFQKITALFEVEDGKGTKDALVLRLGKNDRFLDLDAGDISKEYEVVKFLNAAGIPVAEPILLEAGDSPFGNPFFISRRVTGENIGTSIGVSGITDEVAKSFIESIAKVHTIPLSAEVRRLAVGRWLDFRNPQDNSRANVEYWRSQPWMKAANPSPVTEHLVNWLTENIPQEDVAPCLIHCDYGPHNVLVRDGKVAAILDWESVRIGDPAEDISWFLQSCRDKVDYTKAIQWYEAKTGFRVSEYRLRYHDVLGCLKTMVASGSAAAMYEAHDDASIVWCDLSLLYTSYATGTVDERIRRAEAARGH